jgi:cell division protein FtsB
MSDPTSARGGQAVRPREPAAGAWQRLLAWLSDGEAAATGQLPRFFLLFLLLFGAGMILISLVGDQGLIAYYGLRRDAQALREDVTRLDARREELTREIEALRSDPDYIAHLARKRLGLVKPGETVVQLPPVPHDR